MRKLAHLILLPALLAGIVSIGTASAARAATDGLTETGTTTYRLVPDKGLIHVAITIGLKNTKPDSVVTTKCGPYSTCTDRTRYYWNSTYVTVENESPSITATSDAGSVSQSVTSNEGDYRTVKLTFPNVYYGQTRTVTVTYDIKGGGPRADTLFRAGKAYANFCFGGQGRDTGSVSAILPTGFEIQSTSGDAAHVSSTGGATTLSSGTTSAPYNFFSCVEATNASALASTSVSSGNQKFTVRAWPEDKEWASKVGSYVSSDFTKLESMIGLAVPGTGTISISEAANSELGAYDGFYDPRTRTAEVSEDADPATVAHELSHIWFNDTLFKDTWMGEGFAGYAEQVAGAGKYTACKAPGTYPGSGTPNLERWPVVDAKSTKQERAVLTYDYDAACWIVTDIGKQIGADRLKKVLAAGSAGQLAYQANGSAGEKYLSAQAPLDARHLLDLFDELGMVPAGVKDLDATQKLFAQYGVLSDATLDARSKARAAYHALEASAGDWALPLAIRVPMSEWDFTAAQAATKTATEIVGLRDQIRSDYGAAALTGTSVQDAFQKATDQKSLDALLTTVQHVTEAGAAVTSATDAFNKPRSIVEQIGLVGTDLKTPLDEAHTAIADVRPDDAIVAANTVTDALANANGTGTMRIAAAAGVLAVLLLLLILLFVWRRRRRHVVVLAPGSSPAGSLVVPSVGSDEWGVWRGPDQLPPPPPPDPNALTQTWTASPASPAVETAPPAVEAAAPPPPAVEAPAADAPGVEAPAAEAPVAAPTVAPPPAPPVAAPARDENLK